MSIGNTWLRFNYTTGLTYVYGENYDVTKEDDLTLISNGSGKTVVLVDAPLFALYGKSQRRIKRSEIINIQNGGDCEVRLCLEKDGVEYIIERGLKPDKVIIIKDGVAESEEAKKRQANKIIEEEILDGISYEVFKNLIVLNGTTSKHFFEYGKSEKRMFINEVFRLGFLDYIQCQLTDEVKEKKSELEKAIIRKESKEGEIKRLKGLVEAQENGEVYDNTNLLLEKINLENNNLNTSQTLITEIKNTLFEGDIENYKKKIEIATSKISETNNEIVRLNTSINNLQTQYNKLKNDYEKIAHESICSHCSQRIPEELKGELYLKLQSQGSSIQSSTQEMRNQQNNLNSRIVLMKNWLTKSQKTINDYQSHLNQLNTSTTLLKEYNYQLNAAKDPVGNLDNINEEIKVADTELKDLTLMVNKATQEYQILKVTRDLVGGKNFYGYYIGVFRNYLNKSINEYLEKMVSPHRIKFNNNLEADVFDGNMGIHSYGNLSTGEKSKVNIALLLSFFDVLHSFHRMETSLLVLDEVLDTGIDSTGVEMLHQILKEKIQDNELLGIYVVSHKKPKNTFDKNEGIGKVIFEKKMGFTTLGVN